MDSIIIHDQELLAVLVSTDTLIDTRPSRDRYTADISTDASTAISTDKIHYYTLEFL